MKFCKDCQYALGDTNDLRQLKCGHEKNAIDVSDTATYAVTGVEQPTVSAMLASSCIAMRTHSKHPALGMTLCGPDGVWWEELV